MSEDILITASQIRDWQGDKERLKLEIAERQQELAGIEKNLEAAATLAAVRGQKQLPIPNPPAKSSSRSTAEPVPRSMTDALQHVANTSSAPLTKQELRDHLATLGFKDKGPYLYTVVMRLKDRGKISVMSDGKVWRAPPQQ